MLHWKDTFIDGKHVGYHSKQWSMFWGNPPDSSIGVGTRSRTQKSIKFVLIFYSCVVSWVSQIWFTSFFLKKKKHVVLKALTRYNTIHSVWSMRATPALFVKSKHSQSENGININHHSWIYLPLEVLETLAWVIFLVVFFYLKGKICPYLRISPCDLPVYLHA